MTAAEQCDAPRVDLSHLNLRVRDAAACRDFYERHFGFRPALEADGGSFRNDDGFLLALIPADPHQPLPEGFHAGFGLDDADSVLRSRRWDPDGTEVEVFWEEP